MLISGAAQGIGAAAARELVRRGASVALIDVEAKPLNALADELGERAGAWTADVTDLAQLESALDGVLARFGGVDAVLVNAGIEIFGGISDMDPADFARVIEVNLIGAWRTVRATLPAVVRSRGYYLLVTSLSAVTHAPYNGAYDASKAGVVSLARTLRLELRLRGVDVGIAYLSYVDTASARKAVESPRMRPIMARMPGGAPRPVPVVKVARAFATAIERRSARVVVPRSAVMAVYFPELVQAVLDRVLRDAVPGDSEQSAK